MANNIAIPDDKHETIVSAASSANTFLAQVTSYVIDSPEMYEIGNAELSAIREREVRLEEARTSITKPINEGLRAVNALFAAPAGVLKRAKEILSTKMLTYSEKLRVEREAAERVAAEATRKAREAAELELVAAEQAAAKGEISEEKLMEVAGAAAVAAVAMPMAAAYAPLAKAGNATKKSYVAEVADLPQLLRHIADSLSKGERTFDNTIDIKLGQLNKFGNATQGSVSIPGVTWKEDKKIIARRAG